MAVRPTPWFARRGWILTSAISGTFAAVLLGFTSIMAGSWTNVPMAAIFGAGSVNQWVRYRRDRRARSAQEPNRRWRQA